jgi:putative transposase
VLTIYQKQNFPDKTVHSSLKTPARYPTCLSFYLESSVFSIQGRPVSSSYDKLGVSGFIHYRINYSKEFADRQNYINGIENFWNQAKRVLRKYNGIDRKSFPLFLKECEFRFNFGTPSQQLKILRDWCGM